MTGDRDPTASPRGPCTLRLLVERLYPQVIDLLCAPGGLDVPVGQPVIFDAADPTPLPPDSVVLAVGADPGRARASLIQNVAADGGSVVVVKDVSTSARASLVEVAEQSGIALLCGPPTLSWGQLFTLLLTAATASPPLDAETDETPLGDLFALANAVAAMTGGATTIEDPQSRVLAYSNAGHVIDAARQRTILGRQVPDAWLHSMREAGVFRRLWGSEDVIRVDGLRDVPDFQPRLAVAVRAGGEPLGSLWVAQAERPLGPDAETALREAAGIAALHLLRHRAAHDLERRQRADVLLAVLDGRERGERARDVLGVKPDATATVIGFEVAGDHDAALVLQTQRVADLVAVYCEAQRKHAACAVLGQRIYALLPGAPGAGPDAIASLAQSIVKRACDALHVEVRAGIGSTRPGLDSVTTSRREADQILDVIATRPTPAVATIDQVQSAVILQRLRELAATEPDLLAGPVLAMAEHDAAKGTSWIATLRAHLDAFGDTAVAAARVNVHRNTFRYRIRRISELFGLDLTDPDDRLVAELQLRLLDPSDS